MLALQLEFCRKSSLLSFANLGSKVQKQIFTKGRNPIDTEFPSIDLKSNSSSTLPDYRTLTTRQGSGHSNSLILAEIVIFSILTDSSI